MNKETLQNVKIEISESIKFNYALQHFIKQCVGDLIMLKNLIILLIPAVLL